MRAREILFFSFVYALVLLGCVVVLRGDELSELQALNSTATDILGETQTIDAWQAGPLYDNLSDISGSSYITMLESETMETLQNLYLPDLDYLHDIWYYNSAIATVMANFIGLQKNAGWGSFAQMANVYLGGSAYDKNNPSSAYLNVYDLEVLNSVRAISNQIRALTIPGDSPEFRTRMNSSLFDRSESGHHTESVYVENPWSPDTAFWENLHTALAGISVTVQNGTNLMLAPPSPSEADTNTWGDVAPPAISNVFTGYSDASAGVPYDAPVYDNATGPGAVVAIGTMWGRAGMSDLLAGSLSNANLQAHLPGYLSEASKTWTGSTNPMAWSQMWVSDTSLTGLVLNSSDRTYPWGVSDPPWYSSFVLNVAKDRQAVGDRFTSYVSTILWAAPINRVSTIHYASNFYISSVTPPEGDPHSAGWQWDIDLQSVVGDGSWSRAFSHLIGALVFVWQLVNMWVWLHSHY